MGFRLWIGKEFETTHERVALRQLVRQLVTRFGDSPNPCAIFVEVSIGKEQIDVVALTSCAILIAELKEARHDQGVLNGTPNGAWSITFSNGQVHQINPNRRNPLQQLRAFRYELRDWLQRHGDHVFGAQRHRQLNLQDIQGRLVVSPGLDTASSQDQVRDAISSEAMTWFDVCGLDEFCDQLYSIVTPNLELFEENIEALAASLGLTERTHFDDIFLHSDIVLPEPMVFAPPHVPKRAIDRAVEMERLLAAINDPAVTVLVIAGAGGVGKTHLAARVTEAIQASRRVYWIYGEDHPELSLETLLLAFANVLPDRKLAQIVADPHRSETTRCDIVIRFFDEDHVCLVLDDYHLLRPQHGIDRFLRRLAERSTQGKVVLTARQRPGFGDNPLVALAEVHEEVVSGLPKTEVVAFLQQHSASPSVNADDADDIWRACDGVPEALLMLRTLALQRNQPIAQVARELDIFAEEEAGKWFHEVLKGVSPEAQEMAGRLSFVRGIFSQALIDAVGVQAGTEPRQQQGKAAGQGKVRQPATAPPVDVRRLQTELQDNYLLLSADRPGYFLLSKLLASHLRSQFTESKRRRIQKAIAEFLLQGAGSMALSYQQALERKEAIYHAYHAQEWKSVLDHARPVVSVLSWSGDWRASLPVCEQALKAAEETHRDADQTFWLLELARHYRHLRRTSEAQTRVIRALELAQQMADRSLLARAHHERAMLAQMLNDPNAAMWGHEQALEISQDAGDLEVQAISLGKLGDLLRMRGRFEEASAYYERSLSISEQRKDHQGMAITLVQLGTLAKYDGRLDEAQTLLERSLALSEQTGHPLSSAIVRSQLAEIRFRRGDLDDALERIDRCITQRRELFDDSRSIIISLGIKADILMAMERLDDAEVVLTEIRELLGGKPSRIDAAFDLRRRGEIAVRRGNPDRGQAEITDARKEFQALAQVPYAQECDRILEAFGLGTSAAS